MSNSTMICIYPHLSIYDSFNIYQPFIIPLAFIGMIIGFKGFKKFHDNVYSVMFLCFFFMNLSAIFANCLFPSYWYLNIHSNFISIFFNLIDAFFSSLVNYSFILCGLIDIKIINSETEFSQLFIFGALLISIGYLLVFSGLWPFGFTFLYLILCIIGMLVFTVCSFIFLYRNYKLKYFCYVLNALLIGFVGIIILKKSEWFCEHSPWINNIVLWFLFSDLAMLSIFKYVEETNRLEN
jgi:hypothetical protein